MATLDVVTLDEVKTRLGGSVARVSNDADIEADITALSALFDDQFGAVVQRTVTDEEITHPYPYTASFPRVETYVNAWTDMWPIVGTPTADVGTVVVLNRRFGRVELSTSAATTITYDAGRYDDTASVSEQFKAAFIVTLRNWRQAEHVAPYVPANPDYPTPRTSFPTFALPNSAAQLLHQYMRLSSAIA